MDVCIDFVCLLQLNDVAGMASIGLQSVFSAVTSLAGPLAGQIVSHSPLAHVPNPISAVGNIVPASVASTLAAGLPPNPFGGVVPSPAATETAFDAKDMDEINAELEKLGGESSKPTA